MAQTSNNRMTATARYAAVAALVRLHKGGWANLAVKDVLGQAKLPPREAAFATALFYGTAERLVTLDAILAPYLKKPVEKLDVEVRAVLETGLYQMLYMNVPPRAAVDEAVKLVRAYKKTSAAGMVNAILRRAQSANPDALAYTNERERVQVVWSVSGAVAEAAMQAMPQSYDAFFASSFTRPALALRANTLKASPAALTQRLGQQGAKAWAGTLPGCLYAELPGGVAADEGFAQGLYHVQGEASQYACACLDAKPGERVLDVCAAPGGKSATLAQQMGGGEGLTACDIRPHRVGLIRETLTRLGIEGVQVMQNDAAVYNPALAGQDRVLCDVPCSGLGVLASKPDLRYNNGEGFDTLPPLQLEILSTAARYVKQGGRLVYSTCTVRPQENGEVVQAFLAANADFKAVFPSHLPEGASVEKNMMTILPQFTGLDGFFVATLERL